MDVERGLCWRCEMKEAKKKCTRCNIAEYCGTQCLDRDKIRHQVECDMWNRDQECARCQTKIKCSSCTACKEIVYCSRECQRKHWPSHKTECKQVRQKVKNGAERLRGELKYYKDGGRKDLPFYIGNSLAVDVLKLGLNEAEPSSDDVASQLARDYNILFAGVGDLRNLLLTTVSLPSNFTGNIRFTLNDIDPFLLARDVLFLYMMITRSSRESIETSITNIWYSIKLPDEDFHLLMSTLSELMSHTVETLKGKTNNHLDIVEGDFEKMKEVWRNWIEMECETGKRNSINLSAQRASKNSKPSSSDGILTYTKKIPQNYRESADKYFENGLLLPQNDRDRSDIKYDNPTLTGTEEFVYCIRADIMPFNGWDYIQAKKLSQPDSIVDLFHTYITNVIKSAMSYFQNGKVYLRLILKSCIDLCETAFVEPIFDRIMTSNIADFIDIRVLLASLRPLLSTTNKHAVLITETLNWVTFCPETYLNYQTHKVLSDAMVKDTGRHDLKRFIQINFEYFDDTTLFIRYLRMLFLATTDEPSIKEKIPFFLKSYDNIEGFRLRDFTKELNKVIPFRYRLTARLCNNDNGYQRNLEWQLV